MSFGWKGMITHLNVRSTLLVLYRSERHSRMWSCFLKIHVVFLLVYQATFVLSLLVVLGHLRESNDKIGVSVRVT